MNSGKRGETLFVILLMLGLLAFVLGSLGYPVQLRTMPQTFGLAGIVLLVLVLVGNRFAAIRRWTDTSLAAEWGKVPKSEKPESTESEESAGSIGRIIAYMMSLWVAVLVFGLAVSIPLFITIFLTLEAGVRLRNAAISSAVAIAIVVVGLQVMGIDLWAGIMPEVVPGYIGGSIMPLL